MSNYNSLKATINANIKANGNEEITGPVLNSVLTQMTDSLGAGYQFAGVATPSTDPGTPDQRVFWIALRPGTYANFGGTVIASGRIGVFIHASGWTYTVVSVVDTVEQRVEELAREANGAETPVDYQSLPAVGYSINGNTQRWAAVTNVSGAFIPVTPGDIYKIGGRNNDSYFALVQTNETSGTYPTYCAGYYGRISTSDYNGRIIVIPSDCHYIYFMQSNSSGTVDSAVSRLGAVDGSLLGMLLAAKSELAASIAAVDSEIQPVINEEIPEIANIIGSSFYPHLVPDVNIESGTISTSTGNNGSNPTKIRTSGHIDASALTVTTGGNAFYAYGYKADGTFISSTGRLEVTTDVEITGAARYRVVFSRADNANINPSDFPSLGISIKARGNSVMATQDDIKEINDRLLIVPVDTDSIPKQRYVIANNNKWTDSGGKAGFLPVTAGEIYKVVANPNAISHIAFLTQMPTTTGTTPDYSSAYPARIDIPAGDYEVYETPSDAAYLYFRTETGSGTDVAPTLFKDISYIYGDILTTVYNEVYNAILDYIQQLVGSIQGDVEREYPLTTLGEMDSTGTIVASYTSEYCDISVERWRGFNIVVNNRHSSTGISRVFDSGGNVVASFTGTMVGTYAVPSNASRMTISNDFTLNPDFHILVPKELARRRGTLFEENFLADYSVADFSKFGGTITANRGLSLPAGTSNRIRLEKVTTLDNWTLGADVLTQTNTEAFSLGTEITQRSTGANHSTRVDIDLSAGTMKLYNNKTGTLVATGDISGIVNGNIYYVRLDRIDRNIRATLWNKKTGASVYVESLDGAEGSGQEGINPAGKMFDSPIFYVISGQPYLQGIHATCLRDAKVLFVGDSLTAGAHTTVETSWAQMAAEEFGNSLTGGRGSGEVICCLNELRTLLPVVRPKAVVITIGTNSTSGMSADGYTGLYKSIVNIVKHYGAIPILNHCPACDARKTALTVVNGVIDTLGEIGCRFDLATSLNNDWADGQNTTYYYTDNVHLSVAGNQLLYDVITSQLGWLKNL